MSISVAGSAVAPTEPPLGLDRVRLIEVPPSSVRLVPQDVALPRVPPGQFSALRRVYSATNPQTSALPASEAACFYSNTPLRRFHSSAPEGPRMPWARPVYPTTEMPLASYMLGGDGDQQIEVPLLEAAFATDAPIGKKTFTYAGLLAFGYLLAKCRDRADDAALRRALDGLARSVHGAAELAHTKTVAVDWSFGPVVEHNVLGRLARGEAALCPGGWQTDNEDGTGSHFVLVYAVPNPQTGRTLLTVQNRAGAPCHTSNGAGGWAPLLSEVPTAYLLSPPGRQFFVELLALQERAPEAVHNEEAFYEVFYNLVTKSGGRILVGAPYGLWPVTVPFQPEQHTDNCIVATHWSWISTALHIWFGTLSFAASDAAREVVQKHYKTVKDWCREEICIQGLYAWIFAIAMELEEDGEELAQTFRKVSAWLQARGSKHPELARVAALLAGPSKDVAERLRLLDERGRAYIDSHLVEDLRSKDLDETSRAMLERQRAILQAFDLEEAADVLTEWLHDDKDDDAKEQ